MEERMQIVFSTNEVFYNYTYVAICSLIENNDNYGIDVYILVKNMSGDTTDVLESLSTENISVKCIFLGEYLKDNDLRGIKHLSPEALFRIFIPKVIPNIKRVLYLDSDILIRRELKELYDVDLNGHIIGATREYKTFFAKEHAESIGMTDCDEMFNSGVLLIDCEKFEKNSVRDRSLELLTDDYKNIRRRYIFLDQDILNCVLEGDVQWVDSHWNVQTQYLNKPYVFRQESFFKEYEALCENPWIIHFAGENKPWSDLKVPHSQLYWDAVRKSDRAYEILEDEFIKKTKAFDDMNCFRRFRFPYEQVRAGSSVVIYGAGMVGRDFINQLDQTDYAEVVMCVDKNHDKIDDKIRGINDLILGNAEYDYVVIAIESENISNSVKEDLIKLGISKEKIVWGRYARQ